MEYDWVYGQLLNKAFKNGSAYSAILQTNDDAQYYALGPRHKHYINEYFCYPVCFDLDSLKYNVVYTTTILDIIRSRPGEPHESQSDSDLRARALSLWWKDTLSKWETWSQLLTRVCNTILDGGVAAACAVLEDCDADAFWGSLWGLVLDPGLVRNLAPLHDDILPCVLSSQHYDQNACVRGLDSCLQDYDQLANPGVTEVLACTGLVVMPPIDALDRATRERMSFNWSRAFCIFQS